MWRKRDEDGGVPPMRPLTLAADSKSSDKASKRKLKAPSPQARAHDVRPLIRDFLRKEVIQPQVPLRLPCYDFTPVINPTFGAYLLAVGDSDFWLSQLPWCDGRCVQGPGTYSPRRADPRLLAIPTSCARVAERNPN